MAQFLGDLAFLVELFAVAAGLLLLHRARDEAKPVLLRAAAAVLLVGGIGGAACTGYYWLRYQSRGDFDAADGMTSTAMRGSMPMGDDMPMGGAMHGRGR